MFINSYLRILTEISELQNDCDSLAHSSATHILHLETTYVIILIKNDIYKVLKSMSLYLLSKIFFIIKIYIYKESIIYSLNKVKSWR